MDRAKIIRSTERWLESTVVGLNLCPFARLPLLNASVRFSVSAATTEQQLLLHLNAELSLLEDATEIETTLLVHPCVLQEFGAYNQFLTDAENLLEDSGYEGIYQLASFHPGYQFAGTSGEDAENYSNRSPYPMLHVLRESSVERAVASYPDVHDIPRRNIERLNQVGHTALARMLSESCDEVCK
ncbi:MAG: DUF1415 domain-containing protein [Halioglobus sp.]|nr:DUF1415 domain-containing protein [Halioglobus sp.]